MNKLRRRNEMNLGPLIIVSGPSGSGKSTLIARALAHFGARLRLSVSATTRAPRAGEVDGVSYHFWTRPAFTDAIAKGEFLEYAVVFGNHYYGTPKSEVEPFRRRGIGVVLDIDVQGAEQIRRSCPDGLSVFLLTPEGQYEQRLRQRRSEPEEAIQRRLATARLELARASEFDLRIVNDDLERAARELCAVIENRFATPTGETGRV